MSLHQAMVFGPGQTDMTRHQSDVWIWQMVGVALFCVAPYRNTLINTAMAVCPQEGTSTVTMDSQDFTLAAGDSILIPEQNQYVTIIY